MSNSLANHRRVDMEFRVEGHRSGPIADKPQYWEHITYRWEVSGPESMAMAMQSAGIFLGGGLPDDERVLEVKMEAKGVNCDGKECFYYTVEAKAERCLSNCPSDSVVDDPPAGGGEGELQRGISPTPATDAGSRRAANRRADEETNYVGPSLFRAVRHT